MNRYKFALFMPLVAWMLSLPTPAFAHFLWARLEKGTVRLGLLETPDEPPAAALTEKIAAARAWTPEGTPVALESKDAARCGHLPAGARIVLAEQRYGVMDRKDAGRGVFLLHYHAKAAMSETDAGTPTRAGVEILARRQGGTLIAEVRQGGWPVPHAEVTLHLPGDIRRDRTDLAGKAAFSLPSPVRAGLCGLRAAVVEAKPGTEGGKAYESIRHYATLTFPVDGIKADPAAWNLLKAAHDSRMMWQPEVTGLSAKAILDDNGKTLAGTVSYSRAQGATVDFPGANEEQRRWAQGLVANLMGHRRGGDFAQDDGKNPITFAPDDASPLGRQVVLHDALQSSYRIKDHVVTEVTRTMGGARFTITLLDWEKPDGAHYLPKHFAVTYFDEKTGALQRSDLFSDRHAPIEGNWVPVSRRIVTAEKGSFVIRTLTLSEVRLTRADGR